MTQNRKEFKDNTKGQTKYTAKICLISGIQKHYIFMSVHRVSIWAYQNTSKCLTIKMSFFFFLTSEGVLLFTFREQCVFLPLSAHRCFKKSFFGHLLFKDTKSRDMTAIISTIKILLCLFCIYPGWTDQQWQLNILIFSYFGRITSYIHTLDPEPGHMQS